MSDKDLPSNYMNLELPSLYRPTSSFDEKHRINWFPKQEESKSKSGEIEEIEDEVEKRYKRFRNFKIDTLMPCDHHYLLRRDNRKSRFRARIKQEWEQLYGGTPTPTFVRVYEYRTELMRVAVTGPPETDFQHCLFFFDIFFPGNYPQDPPEVHYRHYNSNPNSRANHRRQTWFDNFKHSLLGSNKKEKDPPLEKKDWDPKKSNILQVLDDIQNLVMNLKHIPLDESGPLNVPSERTFVLACEMIIAALRKPAEGFEDFVAGHFRRRAHPVLLMFKENKYDGERVVNLFVKLFNAFEKNGAYCKHHLDFLKSRNLTVEEVEGRIRILENHQQEAASGHH